jgi:L-fuculose-phosphate aldolase
MSDQPRQELIETALAMNESSVNQGTSGNLSVRTEAGILITPSGMHYAHLEIEDIVFVDGTGKPSGKRKPSSEWRIHFDIYQHRPDATAIVHAHPVHCSTLACLNKSIPAFHYMVAKAGGRDIPCAEYATFGTQALSDNVIKALQGRKACLMTNHGLMALGPSLTSALALAEEVEHLAQTYRHCLGIGEPVLLDDEEMDRVIEKFKDYGV